MLAEYEGKQLMPQKGLKRRNSTDLDRNLAGHGLSQLQSLLQSLLHRGYVSSKLLGERLAVSARL
jgi:hypothetical protein